MLRSDGCGRGQSPSYSSPGTQDAGHTGVHGVVEWMLEEANVRRFRDPGARHACPRMYCALTCSRANHVTHGFAEPGMFGDLWWPPATWRASRS